VEVVETGEGGSDGAAADTVADDGSGAEAAAADADADGAEEGAAAGAAAGAGAGAGAELVTTACVASAKAANTRAKYRMPYGMIESDAAGAEPGAVAVPGRAAAECGDKRALNSLRQITNSGSVKEVLPPVNTTNKRARTFVVFNR
jgi:hypothetical protein